MTHVNDAHGHAWHSMGHTQLPPSCSTTRPGGSQDGGKGVILKTAEECTGCLRWRKRESCVRYCVQNQIQEYSKGQTGHTDNCKREKGQGGEGGGGWWSPARVRIRWTVASPRALQDG